MSRSILPLKRFLRQKRIKPDVLVLGSTGVWEPKERAALARSLKPLARCVHVVSDMELAWVGALGKLGEGILVTASTGSFAYGRDRCGHIVRVGGLGPLLGDEGSAFWIGREWLKTQPEGVALRMTHRVDTVRAVATLARKPLALSSSNPTARRIVQRAITHLLHQTESAARRLHFTKEIPIVCHGGLFRDGRFHSAFEAALSHSRRRWRRVTPAEPAEVAAAKLLLGPSGGKHF